MEAIPNLPNYRTNRHTNRPKKQVFKYVNGIAFPIQDGDPAVKERPLASTLRESSNATSLMVGAKPQPKPKAPSGDAATFVKNCNDVLCFYGYFKESVTESALENHRVRKCDIYYYLEDDSIQVNEHKQENSGIPQGTFIRRHQVQKNEDEFFTLDDFDIGASITIYGRTFHVVSCNAATKRYLERTLGRPPVQALPFPADKFEMERVEFMSRETGCDPGARHNIKKNPMKDFAEAKLGNTVNNAGREGFLRFDRKVLRFHAVWDDRGALYGDLQEFKVHYFLTDDTMEVLTVPGANNGRDPYPLLLKRARLPRNGQPVAPSGSQALAPPAGGGGPGEEEAAGFYAWRDLYVGAEINVYSRRLQLVDADATTRRFYEQQGTPLAAALGVERPRARAVERQLPPPTGFGSEEDSLASCVGSLVLKPPVKTFKENRVLRYMATMVTRAPEDAGRTFVIQYFITDDTIMVAEPPKRNSGIIGGKFLARMPHRHADGAPVRPGDLYVGQELQLMAHRFRVVAADEAALRYMEITPEVWPEADPRRQLGKLRRACAGGPGGAGALAKAAAEYDEASTGVVGLEALRSVLATVVPEEEAFSEQALITICRAFGGKNDQINYEDLVRELES